MTYVIIQRPWIAESFMQSLLNSGFKTQILNIWFLSFLFEHLVDVLFKATVPPAAAAAIHISPSPNPPPRPVWHEPRHWMDPKCFLLRRCQGRSNWAEKKEYFSRHGQDCVNASEMCNFLTKPPQGRQTWKGILQMDFLLSSFATRINRLDVN